MADEISRAGKHGIFLSNLIDEVSLLFADDVALALVSYFVVGLQNQLNVLVGACAKTGLKVNLNKTKVMVFRKGKHLEALENGS